MLLSIIGLICYIFWCKKPGMQCEYRDRQPGFADLLRYATPVADGIIMGKGGELIAGVFYRGSDADAAGNHELEAISARLNQILASFGSGWMMHIDVICSSAIGYAPEGSFDSPVARLMDTERRTQYHQEGNHFSRMYAIVFTYLPPMQLESKVQASMFEYSSDLSHGGGPLHDQIIDKFSANMRDIEIQLSSIFEGISRMRCYKDPDQTDGSAKMIDELYSYLHYCVTGIKQKIIRPDAGVYADSIIASQDFTGGTHPKVGENHIRVLSIEGFPAESIPGILKVLDTLPLLYRWSTRFIFLDPEQGKRLLNAMHRRWKQKIRGLRDQMMNTQSGAINEDAFEMTRDTQQAIAEAESGIVRYGHYTSVVVLMDKNVQRLEDNIMQCAELIRNLGFTARIETINAVEAYLGSLPGHGYENVRRFTVHSLNLAHLIPTTATWQGLASNPCPFYPRNSPPLMYAATSGNTPFHFSLHVGDVGHTLIAGPTGAGKSTLLELIAAQHLRYAGAKVFKFDKGYSSFVLCHAIGGDYYDIGSEHQDLAFCPLGQIDQPTERLWAEEYIQILLQLQNFIVQPQHRNAIRQALILLSQSESDRRSMTEFRSTVQDDDIKVALEAYTLDGGNPMLDAVSDNLSFGKFQVFEMEHLMSMGNQYAVPVLLYLCHRIEQQLDGSPALLILDEAWLMLQHPLFREKIRMWLKDLRKANCCVVFATQSISDIGKSVIRDVVYESCPTKILLTNVEARSNQASFEQYKLIGLNDREIDMLSMATPKRDYYYLSPLGKRMFQLNLGPLCLSFVGVSGKADIAKARAFMTQYTYRWPVEWLQARGVTSWANLLENQLTKEETPNKNTDFLLSN
jgi:type IV secretion system protein VirB4